jgi:hypothetical protein
MGTKVFSTGSGKSFETIQRERDAILEKIKDDLLLKYPGRGDDDKKSKVEAMRKAFGDDVAWIELEKDYSKWPLEKLIECRSKLTEALNAKPNSVKKEK